ncbi:Nif11-like leader peptide family RiPP precursor [Anabaena cylindrica UHCC 0172]|uniref:Nif11-like leader peptide family RiPP precursor n=1 Tax=Anabaena cylindrica TaxID=1165 RepID=UPI002B1F393B|nr:Nif11-like leader peptide family RiPP precursor [Anabaena cylindrica]MEA5552455.1 Nif11-like leader peptide family RiPP precursor [Anabaena cylindrica UHCC 0172]
MSLENVRAFYEKLAADEDFRTQIQEVDNKEVGREFLKASGYNFTQEEFEEYTEQLLESGNSPEGLRDLNEKELEAVFGGATSVLLPIGFPILLYGVVISQIGRLL